MKKLFSFLMITFLTLFVFTGYIIYKDESSKVVFKSDGKSDYAAVRDTFVTSLKRKGPAPKDYKEAIAPDDAEAVIYKSGDLELKAWRTKYIDKNKKNPAVA